MSDDSIAIVPLTSPLAATMRPPGSKSITNRAWSARRWPMARARSPEALDSEDTQVMIAGLGQLGISIAAGRRVRRLRIGGCGGRLPASAGRFVRGQ